MPPEDHPYQPSLPWRTGAALVMGMSGLLSRCFLLGANRLEVHGLDRFMELVDERQDIEGRQRGLITVSNHLSVVDDPLIWGVLPFSYHWSPNTLRWSLGSYDICFTNKYGFYKSPPSFRPPVITLTSDSTHRARSLFFALGQVLPTHRIAHSPHGGLFQPTMTQAIRLLSSGPFTRTPAPSPTTGAAASPSSPDLIDPFSSNHLTYTTNGIDTFPAPSAYVSRRHAWIHIFPEGKIHQHPEKTMRYFKWGVARLILESEPCPDVVPVWIEGTEGVMHESREWPRWVPRAGKEVKVTFGEKVDVDSVFGDLRERWRKVYEGERRKESGQGKGQEVVLPVGVLTEELKYGEEAVRLRMECTMRVREKVLEVRRSRGYPDEDPKARLVDTWRKEGPKREGKMDDGSWVRDT